MIGGEVVWDLSEIFPSVSDASVQKAMDEVSAMAEAFAAKYHGKIGSLTAAELAKCLQEYEAYLARLRDVTLFAELSFAANMTLPETQKLHDRAMKLEAKLGKLLAFLELEVGRLVYDKPELLADPALANYRHYLEKLRRMVPHQLSETEEKLIIDKDQFGVYAWEEFQAKWLNTRTFEVTVEGEKKLLPFGAAYGLFSHPDRATRESAYKAVFSLVGKDGEVFASAFRNICNDWLTVCEWRKYSSPMEASLIVNDTDQQTIDNLLRAVEENVGIYQRYLRLKAKLMGLPKLGCHDILAPLPDAPDMKFTFEQARDLVTKAYESFDKEYAYPVKDMFQRRHIDATPRYGKQHGAFCAGWYNGKTAYILQSFNGRLNDLYTLAHELGHAVHDYYCYRSQTMLNTRIPMVVAETASIFGELLLTDLLLKEAKTDTERKVVLCRVLDGAGRVIFSVTARAWFEQSAYDAVKRGEYLSHEAVCRLWVAARDKVYGDAVEWFNEMLSEWSITPHYYMANFRFYNYPYVYAQLFVYALYQKYLAEEKAFVPKMKQMLAAGGSLSPAEIAKIAGYDTTKKEFWQIGIGQYEHFLKQLEEIAKQNF
ncbi:MAG: M3 family oligoendopeptidase [Candidatus Bathyarchaeota archaeon]|nr:M3 family oligoendopeptidase [Candidatus Bathyarchaeota archaeon]MDW8040990.1 M3 family oligoendopeptidase [Nitrososphaerota archaeon]